MSTRGAVTVLLRRHADGDPDAFDELISLVYKDLRRIAQRRMRTERAGHSLTPTAVVHEAYLRLVEHTPEVIENRVAFFGLCARVMRNILCDHARARSRRKRGAEFELVSFDDAVQMTNARGIGPTEVDLALIDLERIDPQASQVAELRFFAGLSIPEIAEYMKLSEATVSRRWAAARQFLYKTIGGSEAGR